MKRVLLSLVLLAAAGFSAFFVKDAMDRRHPDYAVAKLTVTADSVELPVMVAEYDWSFAFGASAKKETASIIDLGLSPMMLLGGERLELDFSQAADSVTVERSGNYDYNFAPAEGALSVPFESGGYVYRITAEFPSGHAVYYFYVVVQ